MAKEYGPLEKLKESQHCRSLTSVTKCGFSVQLEQILETVKMFFGSHGMCGLWRDPVGLKKGPRYSCQLHLQVPTCLMLGHCSCEPQFAHMSKGGKVSDSAVKLEIGERVCEQRRKRDTPDRAQCGQRQGHG